MTPAISRVNTHSGMQFLFKQKDKECVYVVKFLRVSMLAGKQFHITLYFAFPTDV